MGCMLSAASCNKWWAEEILQTRDFAAEQAPIQKLGENNVFFLPYLMGERSPHNNPDARGVFFGMSMDTTRADMTQAVLEGVAFGLRDSLEVARKLGIKIERTKICGGGAKSPLWKKIIANVMNLKVDVLEVEEGPSMGGAMLAAVGCGAYPDVETVGKKMAHVVDTVEPEEELVAKYEEKYQKFKKLYPSLKPLFLRFFLNKNPEGDHLYWGLPKDPPGWHLYETLRGTISKLRKAEGPPQTPPTWPR